MSDEGVAQDVLANRREHDVCNRNECFYPAVVQLAERVQELEEALRRVRTFAESMDDEDDGFVWLKDVARRALGEK